MRSDGVVAKSWRGALEMDIAANVFHYGTQMR